MNEPEHSIEIRTDGCSGDAQRLDAMIFKPPISRRVSFGARCVRSAVHLDHERGLGTIEVRNERPDRMLATNPHTELASAQLRPEHTLWHRHRPPKPARVLSRVRTNHRHASIGHNASLPPPSSPAPRGRTEVGVPITPRPRLRRVCQDEHRRREEPSPCPLPQGGRGRHPDFRQMTVTYQQSKSAYSSDTLDYVENTSIARLIQ